MSKPLEAIRSALIEIDEIQTNLRNIQATLFAAMKEDECLHMDSKDVTTGGGGPSKRLCLDCGTTYQT